MKTATLLVQCPDRPGIVSRISTFIFDHGGNILRSDQHSTDVQRGRFFMRVAFCFDENVHAPADLRNAIAAWAGALEAHWQIFFDDECSRIGILVSRQDHCLADLLYRFASREYTGTIACVISNHEKCRTMVESAGIPFHFLPVTKETRPKQEETLLSLLTETDVCVLARYMQILSDSFITRYNRDIINIHHSFLPSFKGADPYRQAYERGVKLIGATAHYVTRDLDEGPIIEQAVERVSHRDSVDDLKRKGKNLEKAALASALHAHLEHRVIRFANKTIKFD